MNYKDVQIFDKDRAAENDEIYEKLGIMLSLGFDDTKLNMGTLLKNDFNVDVCLNVLRGQHISSTVKDQPSRLEPENTKNSTESHAQELTTFTDKDILNAASCSQIKAAATHQLPQNSECSICCNEYGITSPNWIILQCSHKLCVNCYNKIETTRTTMAGVQHTFIKCPFCLETSGIEIGTCPNGTLTTYILHSPCAGYEECNTICINYIIPIYRQTRRAFLPDNDEGRTILHLLRIAWDRRLCFSIGTSGTTGREDVLVWNIHPKTAQQGGIEKHGFPDTTYLDRVKSKLKDYCIES